MNTKLPSDDEISDLKHLKSYSKKEPFNAPEGYFDTLTSKIQDRLSNERFILSEEVKAKRPIFIFATILTVCISAGIFFFMINANKPQQQEVACSYEDLIESGYYIEMDENAIAEKLIATNPINSKEDQAIEDYLINNSDESLLTNQF